MANAKHTPRICACSLRREITLPHFSPSHRPLCSCIPHASLQYVLSPVPHAGRQTKKACFVSSYSYPPQPPAALRR